MLEDVRIVIKEPHGVGYHSATDGKTAPPEHEPAAVPAR
jgi:hypothetical protein